MTLHCSVKTKDETFFKDHGKISRISEYNSKILVVKPCNSEYTVYEKENIEEIKIWLE